MSFPILLQDLGMQFATPSSKQKTRAGLYKCKCGNTFKSMTHHIKSGSTKSCGCLGTNNKHNLTKHRLYSTWKSMMQRCYNKNTINYVNYGWRGIKVCDEWLDVRNFIEDMYPSFKEGLTLDRIDVDGNYEPSNCRWVDNFVQARNTRKLQKNNTSGYRGVYFDKYANKWSVIIGVNKKKIKIGYFKTAEEGARAYDKYVIDNNLEHPTNFKREDK